MNLLSPRGVRCVFEIIKIHFFTRSACLARSLQKSILWWFWARFWRHFGSQVGSHILFWSPHRRERIAALAELCEPAQTSPALHRVGGQSLCKGLNIWLDLLYLSSTLAKQAKTAYSHPKVYGNTPQGLPKYSKKHQFGVQGPCKVSKKRPKNT